MQSQFDVALERRVTDEALRFFWKANSEKIQIAQSSLDNIFLLPGITVKDAKNVYDALKTTGTSSNAIKKNYLLYLLNNKQIKDAITVFDDESKLLSNVCNEVYEHIMSSRMVIDTKFFVSIIKWLGARSRVDDIMALFKFMVESHDYKPDKAICAVSLLAFEKHLSYGLFVNDYMTRNAIKMNVNLYNLLMKVLERNNQTNQVKHLYEEMVSCGIMPNRITYTVVLGACAESKDSQFGDQVLKHIKDCMIKMDLDLWCSTIKYLNACDSHLVLADLFDHMIDVRVQPNINTCVLALAYCSNPDQIVDYVKRSGISEDTSLYNMLIQAYGATNRIEKAIEAFQSMLKKNIPRDVFTYNKMLTACAECQDFSLGLVIIQVAEQDSIIIDDAALTEFYAARVKHIKAEQCDKK
ncbi:pentatricopeptide repeat-containing protein [Acrasis kona]|uniref:Pentatricopeptide repeat-containing protein n=1 Tax=Acrasis kona TaxID=1008807 RepID=A0AAW2Z9U2_9EUKA